MFENNTILYVGQCQGYDVMLLEVSHSHILPDSDKLIKLLLNNNSRPLIPTTRAIKKLWQTQIKFNRLLTKTAYCKLPPAHLLVA
jgi:hypothetical protein